MKAFIDAGLGLAYDELRVDRTSEAYLVAGSLLRDEVAARLGREVEDVEQVGSSSVLGLLAKPIIDLAVGLSDHHDLAGVRSKLEAAGWIYRGDAGDDGGQVFVLEARPWHRIAHLHVVDHGGEQWRDYLRLRDLLRRSSEARRGNPVEATAAVARALVGHVRRIVVGSDSVVIDLRRRDGTRIT